MSEELLLKMVFKLQLLFNLLPGYQKNSFQNRIFVSLQVKDFGAVHKLRNDNMKKFGVFLHGKIDLISQPVYLNRHLRRLNWMEETNVLNG